MTLLNSELEAIQKRLSVLGLGSPDVTSTDLEVARNRISEQYEYLNAETPKLSASHDFCLEYLDELVTIRCYFPAGRGLFNKNTLLVYLHGGGWSFGNHLTHDGIAQSFSDRSGLTLVSIAYSLAPEKKHPYQNHQIANIIEQILDKFKDDYSVDLSCILIGDSAGANLAISSYMYTLNQHIKTRVAGLILFYGVYATESLSKSWRDLGDGRFGLSKKSMDWYWDQFLSDVTHRVKPMASPLAADNLSLPPVWIAVGDLDPLLDENCQLVEKIRHSGTSCDLIIVPGYTHGFLRFCNHLKSVQDLVDLSIASMDDMIKISALSRA